MRGKSMWRKRQRIKKQHKVLLNTLARKLFKSLIQGKLDVIVPELNFKSYDDINKICTYDVTPIVVRPKISEVMAVYKNNLYKKLALKQMIKED